MRLCYLLALLAVVHPASAQSDSGNPLASIPFESMTDAAGRPPFSPSRRPPAPPPVPLAPPPVAALSPSADHLRLLGTLVGPAGASALILDTTTGTTLALARGQTVGGWRVAAIEGTRVRIEQQARSIDLVLFRPGLAALSPFGEPPRPAASDQGAQPADTPTLPPGN